MSKSKLLFEGTEWSFEKLDKAWKVIDQIGSKQLGLDYYDSQIEIISADQMLDNYSNHALPIMYNHWSFGKSFIENQKNYVSGNMGLAYEVVINTNPIIAYLMESNTMTMQALVMSHAICGHGTVYKTNYLFQEWTDADFILEYLKYAKNYISDCEKKYGQHKVEVLLDACHALQNFGVDKYKKPKKLSEELVNQRIVDRAEHKRKDFKDIWTTIPNDVNDFNFELRESDGYVREENILYFIEKHSLKLAPWEKEIVRIVRKLAQHFYPHRQTSLLHEAFASFTHYTIMTMMWEQGYINDGSFIEFLRSHTGVVSQRAWNDRRYSGINVYALGYAMLEDIKRMCLNPDDEDRKYFPDIAGAKDWMGAIKDIVKNYRSESFLLQFLGPKVIRKFNLFQVQHKEEEEYHEVIDIHDEDGVLNIRKGLAEMHDPSRFIPDIEVLHIDWKDTRKMTVMHHSKNGVKLHQEEAEHTLRYLHYLWGQSISFLEE